MLDPSVRLHRGDIQELGGLCPPAPEGGIGMQEKKDQPGQSDTEGDKKQWPGDEAGKQGGQGDVGKKGGSGEVDRGGGQGGPTGGQPDEKKL